MGSIVLFILSILFEAKLVNTLDRNITNNYYNTIKINHLNCYSLHIIIKYLKKL